MDEAAVAQKKESAASKPQNKYGGYTFTTVGHLDMEKVSTAIRIISNNKFGVPMNPAGIIIKEDPDSDTRLGYINEPANKNAPLNGANAQ